MSSDEKHVYAIVLFLPRKEKNNSIDLVPYSWIATTKTGEICKFPGKEDYKTLSHWVTSLREPDEAWQRFPVEVISYARTLKQGYRRLRRAYTTMDVQSTDGETITVSEMPVLLSNDDLQHELDQMDPLVIEAEDMVTANNLAEGTWTLPIVMQDNEGNSAENSLLAGQIKQCINETRDAILAAINSSKRSILYDVEKKINDVKHAIVANRTMEMPNENIGHIKRELGAVLPIKTVEEYMLFEEALGASEEKRAALKNLNRILVCGETCVKQCVRKVLTATLSKTVEMEYSAFGRRMHGVGKRDFSKTHTYACLNDILLEKYGNSAEYKQVTSAISRWLSGAPGREGGRKRRSCLTDETINANVEQSE